MRSLIDCSIPLGYVEVGQGAGSSSLLLDWKTELFQFCRETAKMIYLLLGIDQNLLVVKGRRLKEMNLLGISYSLLLE